jgi:hypothetical protein
MPAFQCELTSVLPTGWFAKESITLLAPDGQANIIASSEPLDDSIDTHRYAEVQGDLLRKEFPAYQEFSYGQVPMFGSTGYRRQFEWTPPDGAAVTQIQLYYATRGRGYTATATTPSSVFPAVEAVLNMVLESLAISPK